MRTNLDIYAFIFNIIHGMNLAVINMDETYSLSNAICGDSVRG